MSKAEKLAERAENGQYMCEKCACEAYFIYKCLMELQERRQEDDKEVSDFLKGCNHGANE